MEEKLIDSKQYDMVEDVLKKYKGKFKTFRNSITFHFVYLRGIERSAIKNL